VSNYADFSGEISNYARDIREIIVSINNVYAAKNGEDLFKATNKTAGALVAIGEMIKSFDEYKNLVENLYFLFWEGPGAKIAEKPESFKDINTLRTEQEHDVDHGHARDVRKKKIRHGDVFKKYSGVISPDVASPTQFPLLQLGVLRAVKSDLSALIIKIGEIE
jgi:hypothetical protein